MRIAHVKSLYDDIGGIESLLETVLPVQQEMDGVEPLIILIADKRHPEIERRLTSDGRVPMEVLKWRGLKSAPLAAHQMARLLDRCKADVVHTHDMRANLLAAMARPFNRRPWLCQIHGWLGTTHSGIHAVYETIDRRLVRYADHVLVGSHAARAEVQAAGARRTSVAWNAVALPDIAAADRASLGLPETVVVFTMLGRVHRGKGQDLFLEALAGLAMDQPWHGVVVGSGKPEDEAALRERVDRLGLSERVTLTGFVPRTAPWIAASDVIVVPSRKESLPLTCLEGMAAGRAVIVSATGDMPRVVTDGVSGRVIPVGDAGALSAAMADLLADAAKRRRFGAAARARIEQHHTAAALATAMAETAGALVSGSAARQDHRQPSRP
ncbi:glycosyltransferase family 4 protein [Ruegeria marina]|uniref:Glycosyltransferase involved in cell wall bisynthesis n=1 Tax=Ruegeria marina TaxID=639004 RepID=A0A1G6VLL0_9RHOB|nr:glycosyltransferase family 4 protein [Ruegeria marina]SDD54293.1 Glycosyltransferase involved in cell wall bisynthesis [Ruegeria marina]